MYTLVLVLVLNGKFFGTTFIENFKSLEACNSEGHKWALAMNNSSREIYYGCHKDVSLDK